MKKLLLPPLKKTRSKVMRWSVSTPADIVRWAQKEAPRRGFRSVSAFVSDVLSRARDEQAAA